MTDAALEARELRVRRGLRLVVDVPHLAVERGEVLSIIGPNGAGKSTLLRVLALLERPSAGEVFFDGRRVGWKSDLVRLRRRLAIVFQEALLRDATVLTNATTGLWFRGAPRPEGEGRVRPWLERLRIAHLTHRSARTLSGGEAQRVSLARAFVLEPEVLLLDEPFAALDSPSKAALMADLARILAQTRVTTVFVTHDRAEALMLGDRLAVMMGGRIRQLDTPERVLASPADEDVAAFVGAETILPARVVSQSGGLTVAEMYGQRVEVLGEHAPGENIMVCLRPEDLVILPLDSHLPATSARNRLRGRIAQLYPLGSQVRVVVDCGFPVVALITKQSFLDLSLAEGGEVWVSFKASAAHAVRRRG